MSELKPCPFCGETTLELDCFGITDDEQPTDWRVTHIADVPCQAWGPECATRDEAIAAWNRRAPGWRDELARVMETAHRNPTPLTPETFLAFAARWSAPARIALAREMLKGTGRVVARDVGLKPHDDWGDIITDARADGWNACRAAMLEDGE